MAPTYRRSPVWLLRCGRGSGWTAEGRARLWHRWTRTTTCGSGRTAGPTPATSGPRAGAARRTSGGTGWGRDWRVQRVSAPTDSSVAVEIGCGHGRWTQFLASIYGHVIAVDLAPRCVAVASARFEQDDSVTVEQCDGSSLRGVGDESVDLVFSFDSLVHADAMTMDAYVGECARVLRSDGVAFLHHSNLAACVPDRSRLLQRRSVRRILASAGIAEPNVHWRDPTVDADVVARLARRHGLACVEQELLAWGTRRQLIDCISVLRRGTRAVRRNPDGPSIAASWPRWTRRGDARRAELRPPRGKPGRQDRRGEWGGPHRRGRQVERRTPRGLRSDLDAIQVLGQHDLAVEVGGGQLDPRPSVTRSGGR